MQQKQIPLIFYTGLLAGGCICFWNQLQDATLLPRVLFVYIWVLAFIPIWWKLFWNKEFKAGVPDLFFAAYVFFHFFSIIQALNAPEAIYESEKMFLVFICYLLFKTGLRQKIITEAALLKTLAVVCALYGLYAVSQLLSLMEHAKPEGDNLYAINALAGHKNLYSGFMFMSCCLLGILSLTSKKTWRIVAISLIVFQLVMILVLQTRSVFMAVILASGILFAGAFLLRRSFDFSLMKKIALPLALVAGIGILFFVVSGTVSNVLHRLNFAHYFNSDTGIERIVLWYKSFFMLKDHWLLGVGARNWTLVHPFYTYKGMFRMAYLNMVFLQPHNDFIWVWCELGVLGFISFVGLFVSFIVMAYKAIKRSKDFTIQFILLILIAQQAGFMLFSFFDFPKERMEHQMLLALSWAILSIRSNASTGFLNVKPMATKIFMSLAVTLLLFGAIGTGYRLKADSYMLDLLAAKERRDNESAVAIAQLMVNPFTDLTPQGLPKVWFEGVSAYSLGRYEQAYDCFQRAKKLSPYNPNVLNNLGGMQTYYKKYDEALATYRETLRINEKNDDARFNVAYTLYQLHRYDEAFDSVHKVWSNDKRRAEFEQIIKQAADSVHGVNNHL